LLVRDRGGWRCKGELLKKTSKNNCLNQHRSRLTQIWRKWRVEKVVNCW
jgi:hypothetical protein